MAGILFSLVLIGLTAAIYYRDPTRVPLAYLIMAIIAFLVLAFLCWLFFSASQTQSQNYMMTTAGLVLSLLFLCFFVAGGLYMYMYRPYHYNNLIQMRTNSALWQKKWKSRDFNFA